jgi:hypothetical protein
MAETSLAGARLDMIGVAGRSGCAIPHLDDERTMSDLPPPAPGPAPVPFLSRLDPPPDVQAAVSATLHACHAWQPVAVARPAPGSVPGEVSAPAASVEAGVCDMIDNWPQAADATSIFVLSAGVALGLVVAVMLLMVRRVLHVAWQSRLGLWLRDRLGVPWRAVQGGGTGGFAGLLFGLILAKGLRSAGMGGPTVAWALGLCGAAAGTVAGVWLRRAWLRRDVKAGLR